MYKKSTIEFNSVAKQVTVVGSKVHLFPELNLNILKVVGSHFWIHHCHAAKEEKTGFYPLFGPKRSSNQLQADIQRPIAFRYIKQHSYKICQFYTKLYTFSKSRPDIQLGSNFKPEIIFLLRFLPSKYRRQRPRFLMPSLIIVPYSCPGCRELKSRHSLQIDGRRKSNTIYFHSQKGLIIAKEQCEVQRYVRMLYCRLRSLPTILA
jgi:hypothetical protein